jgi:hypothetical protein
MVRGTFYLSAVSILAILFGLPGARPTAAGDDWLPINPADLAAKDCPEKPGAHAIYLYRGDNRDDTTNRQTTLKRRVTFSCCDRA